MSFATVAELSTSLRRGLDADDQVTGQLVLDGATSIIRGYCNQFITFVANETVNLWPGDSNVIFLPELPVTDVASITVNAELVDTTGYVVDTDTGAIWRKHRSRWSYSYGSPVTIVYSHGYNPIPDDIKMVCLDIAKRAMENPAGLARDDLNTASQYLGLTEPNKEVLVPYRVL